MARYVDPTAQYSDAFGAPLTAGRLHFYLSGTVSTPKTTYADPNLLIANPNPVILDGGGRVPPVFYEGSANVELRSSAGTLIWQRDPVGAESFLINFEAWSPLIRYAKDVFVRDSGFVYVSLRDNNINNAPILSSAFWQRLSEINSWNSQAIYQINDLVQASDGFLYRSLSADNLGNDPIIATAFWGTIVASNTDNWVSVTGLTSMQPNRKYAVDVSLGNVVLTFDLDDYTIGGSSQVSVVGGSLAVNSATVMFTNGLLEVAGETSDEGDILSEGVLVTLLKVATDRVRRIS